MSVRPKFYALDAIRGLAALFVLGRHSLDYWPGALFRSYLAVDVFFLLSGFVIAHSYEGELSSGRMTAGKFVQVRLIRLYPMYAITLALALMLNGPTRPGEMLQWAVKGVFMLPTAGELQAFPLNVVYWSLFFELLVNFSYAIFRPALTNRLLMVLVASLGVVLVYLERRTGGLNIGYIGTSFHFLSGMVRASFGIFFGILLYRHRLAIWPHVASRASPYLATLAVCMVLCVPDIGRFTWAVDALAVLVVFPCCLMAASVASPSHGQGLMQYLGTASYPLYLIHPLLAKIGVLVFSAGWLARAAPVSGLLFATVVVVLSAALERHVDLPIRRRIGEWLSVRPAAVAPSAR